MKPIERTRMMRPLTKEEIRLEEPEWLDDDAVIFYVPCWFNVDEVFAGIHVATSENDDYINLYCIYDVRKQSVRLSIHYANNSRVKGAKDFDVDVEPEESTNAVLLQLASEWLQKEINEGRERGND